MVIGRASLSYCFMLTFLVICLFTDGIDNTATTTYVTGSTGITNHITNHAVEEIICPFINHLFYTKSDITSTLPFEIQTVLHHHISIKKVQNNVFLKYIHLSIRIVKKKRTGSIYSPQVSAWFKHGYICRSSPDCHPYIDLTIYMDIASNPGPETPGFNANNDQHTANKHNIRCLYFNARSLSNKTKELQTLATDIDIIAVTETWLKPDILNCELLPGNDFSIHRQDRVGRNGGGVMLAVRNTILSIRRKDLESRNSEILACEIRLESKKKFLVLVLYRPPNTDLDHMKEFKKSLHLATKAKFDHLVVCGDFNLPHIDWSTGTAINNDDIHHYFAKTIKDNYLYQLIDFPTRINNILDLVLTNSPDKVMNIQGFHDTLSTDHLLISFELNLKINKKPKVKRAVFNFKKANWTGLKEVLVNTPFDTCFVTEDIDASLSNWCDLFLSIVHNHIPKCSSRNVYDHPWIDEELLALIKKKNTQRKKLLRTKHPAVLEKFKLLRRQTKKLISKKKRDHANKLRESMFENPKRFWSFLKSSTKTNQTPNFIRNGQSFTTDSRNKANLFNKFFHSVFSPGDVDPPSMLSTLTESPCNQLSDIELTISEVAAVLRNLDPNKACGPDGIPSRLLSAVADEIAPSLCKLFNMSLSLGMVPVKWKFANITPVFKKDDPTITSNYRPISLLCVISKVLERCVFNHCYHHLSPFFYQLQHGFLKGKSTTTQLLEVYHDILDSVASGNEVDVIYLDLSKAFDKVPHNLLLLKLKRHGINGSLLSWFGSYLTDRQQRVALDGTFSDWLPVTSGVPQGSILGPLLFILYANDVPNYIQYNSKIALFADDSKLFRPILNPTSSYNLQSDLKYLHSWSLDWGMEFNKSKCKVISISRKKTSTREASYTMDGQPLECVPYITDLGVTVSNDLSWSSHIEGAVAKANKTLGLVKRVCKDLPDQKVRKLLYCALVRPKLEYASSLWSPYTVKHRSLIENVQRRATKFILNYPPDVKYAERLIKTNLLPLEFRREITDLILLFKSRAGLISTDVNDFLCTFKPGYRSRNYDVNNYNILIKHKQDYFRKSFFIRSAELWNSLPSYLKVYHSLPEFKSTLTKLYFKKLSTYSPPGST